MLSWAQDDLAELERSMLAFFSEKPYEYVTEFDPDAGYFAHRIRMVREAPEAWRKFTSHALGDIRHSIDQSLFAACQALNEAPLKVDVGFPWGTHFNDFKARMEKREYIPRSLYGALAACHPYPGRDGSPEGDNTIFELRKLAGPNKHRIAIDPFVGVHGHSIRSTMNCDFRIPYVPWNASKQEFTFVLTSDDTVRDTEVEVTFGISFGDVGPLEGEPVLGLLPYFGNYAQFVCERLEEEVAEILRGRG